MSAEDALVRSLAALDGVDFTKASEEALVLWIDLMWERIRKAGQAKLALEDRRIRHAQENLDPQPAVDAGGWGAVRRSR